MNNKFFLLSIIFSLFACSPKEQLREGAQSLDHESSVIQGNAVEVLEKGLRIRDFELKNKFAQRCMKEWSDYLVLEGSFFISAMSSKAPAAIQKECLEFDESLYQKVAFHCWQYNAAKGCERALRVFRSQLIVELFSSYDDRDVPVQVLLHRLASNFLEPFSEDSMKLSIKRLELLMQREVAVEDLASLLVFFYSRDKSVQESQWRAVVDKLPSQRDEQLSTLVLVLESRGNVKEKDFLKMAQQEIERVGEKGEIEYFLSRYFHQHENEKESLAWLKKALKKDPQNERFKRTKKELRGNKKKIYYSSLYIHPLMEYF